MASSWAKRRVLANVNGPPSPNFAVGNLVQVHHGDAGATTFDWAAKYGGVVRWDGVFGVSIPSVR